MMRLKAKPNFKLRLTHWKIKMLPSMKNFLQKSKNPSNSNKNLKKLTSNFKLRKLKPQANKTHQFKILKCLIFLSKNIWTKKAEDKKNKENYLKLMKNWNFAKSNWKMQETARMSSDKKLRRTISHPKNQNDLLWGKKMLKDIPST